MPPRILRVQSVYGPALQEQARVGERTPGVLAPVVLNLLPSLLAAPARAQRPVFTRERSHGLGATAQGRAALTLTESGMTRSVITMGQAVRLIETALGTMEGGRDLRRTASGLSYLFL